MSRRLDPLFTPMQVLILAICGIAVVGGGLYFIRDLLFPLILAWILSYVLTPLVDRFESVVRSRALAVGLLFGIFILGIAFLLIVILPVLAREITDFTHALPDYIDSGRIWFNSIKEALVTEYPVFETFKLLHLIQEQVQGIVLWLAQSMSTIILSLVGIISFLSLVPVILFFFLLEAHQIKKKLLELVPNRYFEIVMSLNFRVTQQLGHYLRGVLIEASIVGTLSTVFLTILGVNYAILIGIVAGVCNLVPYLGPISGAIPAAIIFYLQTKSLTSVLYVIIAFVIVQFIDNTFIQPTIYAQSVNLHPLLVLFAVIIGGTYGGILGLMVAVPVAGMINVLISQLYKEYLFRMQLRLERRSLR